jgi:opacity protein-like surface antigen
VAVPAPVDQAPLSWAGFYAGVHLASGWANPTWQSATGFGGAVPFPGGASGNGAVGGGQVGWNYQTGPWVLGVEAAFSAADINAATACAAGAFICTVNVDALGTATGRLGFAFDQFLLYGKAGAAVEHSRDAMVLRPFTAFSINGSPTRSGWTAGTGVEFAFNPALSAFAEYDFLDFGTRGIAMIDSTGVGARVALSEHVHLVKVGLNYRLGQDLASWTAAARTLPLLPVPPSSSNWTGVYVGGHVGGGWGQTNWNSATGAFGNGTTVFAGSGTDNGFAIGGQLGFNYQVGPWVMGVEADADWSDLDGNAPCAASAATGSGFTCHTHINGFGTLAGRLGQSFGNLLVYGKGGAAWDNESHFALDSNSAPNAFAANDTRWGWAIGAGLEYAFTPAWSGKVEYDYLSFANRLVAFSDGAGNVSNVGLSQNINVVKMGFNYKLGADPASPAYAAASVPIWVKAPVFKAPPPSDWTIQAGARYWVSSGRKQLDLAGSQADVLLSRLTYESVAGQAGEAFARLDHRDGMFLKGNFGLGNLQGGRQSLAAGRHQSAAGARAGVGLAV